eukprot:Skav230890  [mRNA]  locus=scaffold2765:170334:170537:- [translate_table: standard]
MSIPRVGHASFALAGRVYVLGGMDGKATGDGDAEATHATPRPVQVVLDTYEVYDIAKKSWLPPQRLG